jgi:hypothetical protein
VIANKNVLVQVGGRYDSQTTKRNLNDTLPAAPTAHLQTELEITTCRHNRASPT